MAVKNGIPVWRDVALPPPIENGASEEKSIVIVGGGPVGLAMALDLGRKGLPVTLISRWTFIPSHSKAICWSKRSLDILDRLGVGQRLVDKGVIWNTGKVFWGDAREPVYEFDLLPVKHQNRPAFVNLQQYYVEEFLYEALLELPNVELRFGHELIAIDLRSDGVEISVKTEDGARYEIDTEWLIACDGNKSTVRELMGEDFEGRVFEDNFLIADIKMKAKRPSERWFWFDPPFNRGQSALLHKQPDDIWRIDLQLGWNIDREACIKPENVEPYLRSMLGDDVEFEKEWYSVYTFQCRRMKHFVHGRVVFAGDSAHLVSPFGARGCNGGFADIDNLGWKLDLILRNEAPVTLLETYNDEAITTADENILNSTRSTDFITPKTEGSRAFRDAVLSLSKTEPFARSMVNSGRLSLAVSYPESTLNTKDEDIWKGGLAPGSPPLDAPLRGAWLLGALGNDFILLANGLEVETPANLAVIDVARESDADVLIDRYDLSEGSAYLIRPDQYIAARWKNPTADKINTALSRATGRTP